MEALFDHEKLSVYQRSSEFVVWTNLVLESLPKTTPTWDQLDRASASIALNIAEGNGKWTSRDRCRFFDIARGSALECAAALDVGVARDFLEVTTVGEGKRLLAEIVRMLIGLIKANDPNREFGQTERVQEDEVFYEVHGGEQEQEQD